MKPSFLAKFFGNRNLKCHLNYQILKGNNLIAGTIKISGKETLLISVKWASFLANTWHRNLNTLLLNIIEISVFFVCQVIFLFASWYFNCPSVIDCHVHVAIRRRVSSKLHHTHRVVFWPELQSNSILTFAVCPT